MLELKQGATDKVIPFLLVSSTDHIAGATAVTPAVEISKNGAAFAAPAGVVAEVGHGWYKLTPTATDTDTPGSLDPRIQSNHAPSCTAAAVMRHLSHQHVNSESRH